MLYLVRHAAPAVRADVSSAQWHLSADGRAGADALAEDSIWSGVRALHASAEPKAQATAQRIAGRHGLPLHLDPELHEVERPWLNEGYADAVRRYLDGQTLDGWEPRDIALARARGAIERVISRYEGADVAVVSHGLALTLYLSDLLALDGAASFQLWSSMGFPDLAAVDPATRRTERSFSGAGA